MPLAYPPTRLLRLVALGRTRATGEIFAEPPPFVKGIINAIHWWAKGYANSVCDMASRTGREGRRKWGLKKALDMTEN